MTHLSGPGIVTSVAKIKPSITNKGTSAKPGVLDVTEEESTESEAESLGWDEDDSNNDHESSSEGNDQKSDNGDNNTQSDNEKGSDSEYETDENETGSEFDQEENEKDVEYDEEDRTTSLSKPRPTLLMKNIKPMKNQRLKIMLKNEKIVSPLDVHVHHEVPSDQTPTLLTVPVLVITESSPIYTTVILQSLPSFTPSPLQSTPTPPLTTEATNPLYVLLNFAFVFQFNNRVSALENEVAELKKDDLLNIQVTALVNEHVDSRLGTTRDEFMGYLLASITARITKQVEIQLP
nr:hypothetical protein [Tanacetum cinerariifolium]